MINMMNLLNLFKPLMAKRNDMKEYYEVRVHCANCGYKGKINVLKSCRVDNEHCPDCDCISLVAIDAHKGRE